MAYDVFLIVFYRYDAEDLRRLEIKFIVIITTLVFVPALAFLFVGTPEKGPMYGSETVGVSIPRCCMKTNISRFGAPYPLSGYFSGLSSTMDLFGKISDWLSDPHILS